ADVLLPVDHPVGAAAASHEVSAACLPKRHTKSLHKLLPPGRPDEHQAVVPRPGSCSEEGRVLRSSADAHGTDEHHMLLACQEFQGEDLLELATVELDR